MRGQYVVAKANAGIADENLRPGNQALYLAVGLAAE
jgi:hypothetical protein